LFRTKNGLLTVNGIAVDTANIETSNGVIHVVEAVLYPAPNSTILDILASDPR
jgi:uncharacterized surface protein with fasciclin (FAS1) repeats